VGPGWNHGHVVVTNISRISKSDGLEFELFRILYVPSSSVNLETARTKMGCAMSSKVRTPEVTRASEDAQGSQKHVSQEHPAVITKATPRLLGPHSAATPDAQMADQRGACM
jgi:hypothetical protein